VVLRLLLKLCSRSAAQLQEGRRASRGRPRAEAMRARPSCACPGGGGRASCRACPPSDSGPAAQPPRDPFAPPSETDGADACTADQRGRDAPRADSTRCAGHESAACLTALRRGGTTSPGEASGLTGLQRAPGEAEGQGPLNAAGTQRAPTLADVRRGARLAAALGAALGCGEELPHEAAALPRPTPRGVAGQPLTAPPCTAHGRCAGQQAQSLGPQLSRMMLRQRPRCCLAPTEVLCCSRVLEHIVRRASGCVACIAVAAMHAARAHAAGRPAPQAGAGAGGLRAHGGAPARPMPPGGERHGERRSAHRAPGARARRKPAGACDQRAGGAAGRRGGRTSGAPPEQRDRMPHAVVHVTMHVSQAVDSACELTTLALGGGQDLRAVVHAAQYGAPSGRDEFGGGPRVSVRLSSAGARAACPRCTAPEPPNPSCLGCGARGPPREARPVCFAQAFPRELQPGHGCVRESLGAGGHREGVGWAPCSRPEPRRSDAGADGRPEVCRHARACPGEARPLEEPG